MSRTVTQRDHLIGIPARLVCPAGQLTLHLPQYWPWKAVLDELLRIALRDPLSTTP